MTFGKRLRELRKEKGLHQSQLASKLNVNQNAISRWESDKNEPSIEMIKQIAKILECDPNYLLVWD